MTKIDLTKRIVALIVGFGTKQIVVAIIRNNVSSEKVTDKIAIEAASWVLSALVASKAKEYTDQIIDELIDQWYKLKSSIKDTRQA